MLQQLHLQVSTAANQLQTHIEARIPPNLKTFYIKPINGLRKIVHNDLQSYVGITQNAAGRFRQMKKDLKAFTNGYMKLILNEKDAFFASSLISCLQQITIDDEYRLKLEAAQTILQSGKETSVLQWLIDFSEYSKVVPNQIVNIHGEYAVVWACSEDGLWIALDMHDQHVVVHRMHISV